MTATVQNTINTLLEDVDTARQTLCKRLTKKRKHGQYFSSASVSDFMASMMDYSGKDILLLDPGAGVGSLFTACVKHICSQMIPPNSVRVVAYEVDDLLSDSLTASLRRAERACDSLGIDFSGLLVKRNFVEDYAKSPDSLSDKFTHVIMNPPYEKIRTSSRTYETLRNIGLPATNMYSAFIAISHRLLGPGGQMTFISPRSFCNGSYFYQFRKDLLRSMSPHRIHLFRSRTLSFGDDGVLQENVIIHARKGGTNKNVTISSSNGPSDPIDCRRVKKSDIVFEDDPQIFIHIVPDRTGARISKMIRSLPCTMRDIRVSVSTGKVVDFRIRDELRFEDEEGTVPLVRPFNISDGIMRFPVMGRKHCNFIMANKRSEKLLVENGNYVLVKRFTTTEQKKRVVASLWSKDLCDSHVVGFENMVNYLHMCGNSLSRRMARGLWMFLNSSAVDEYFRQFNGSTQVNATDLAYLRYPSKRQLEVLGDSMMQSMSQTEIDELVNELFSYQMVQKQ